MYILHKETLASVYGRPTTIGSDSLLKLQTRALKDAAQLVSLNPNHLEYDRIRRHGVITITVYRKPVAEKAMQFMRKGKIYANYTIPSYDKKIFVTYTIRKLVIV